MDGRQGLQPLDLQLGIAQGGGDGAGVHLGLAQLADGGDHVGDVDRRVLGRRQHDAGHLLGLGLGQQAVDLVVVGRRRRARASSSRPKRRRRPSSAMKGCSPFRPGRTIGGITTPAARMVSASWGTPSSAGSLKRRFSGARPRSPRRTLMEAIGVGAADGNGLGIGHRGQAPAPGRGSSCPWAHPPGPFLPPFQRRWTASAARLDHSSQSPQGAGGRATRAATPASTSRARSTSAEASPSLPRSPAISTERTPAGADQARRLRVDISAQPGKSNHSLGRPRGEHALGDQHLGFGGVQPHGAARRRRAHGLARQAQVEGPAPIGRQIGHLDRDVAALGVLDAGQERGPPQPSRAIDRDGDLAVVAQGLRPRQIARPPA